MKVGVTVPLAYGDLHDGRAPTFRETAEFSRHAEQVGLDSIWVFDHLLFRFPPEPDEGLNEAWTTLSALAPVVPRVELGALVMCTSFRNAGLLAKMAATLDDLSDGRLILGVGCGWHQPEYDAFGLPFDHLVGRFEEDLEVIHRLLRGEKVTRDGRWNRYADAELLPPPARVPPILVAAKGERMLRLTAQYAQVWNTAWFGGVDDLLRQRCADLDAACAEVGREPSAIRRTVGLRVHAPGTKPEGERGTDADAVGLADIFDELHDLGFADAVIWSLEKSPAALDRIAEARRTHLARRPAA
ncbi:MAG TPA: LLM class flavin-dependent oxidoreductase [Candidatus Limnocylindrales bacterium]|nr:LLM class flavin-dependent oxidoreductase [Candidatus Limnocylindrales bacterium]